MQEPLAVLTLLEAMVNSWLRVVGTVIDIAGLLIIAAGTAGSTAAFLTRNI